MQASPSRFQWTSEEVSAITRLARRAALPAVLASAACAALSVLVAIAKPSGDSAAPSSDQLAEIGALRADSHRLAELAEGQRARAADLSTRLAEVERRLAELDKRSAAPDASASRARATASVAATSPQLEERLKALEARLGHHSKQLAALRRVPETGGEASGDTSLPQRIYNLEVRLEKQELQQQKAARELLDRVYNLETSRQAFEASRLESEQRLLDRVYQLEKTFSTAPAAPR
jgi:hypothetical protein